VILRLDPDNRSTNIAMLVLSHETPSNRPPYVNHARRRVMEQKLAEDAPLIVGAWKLISFEVRREDGDVIRPFGEDAQGSAIFTESGRFSAQAMRPDRPRFVSGDQLKGTADEIKANYEGFISYYGSYEFDAESGAIMLHVEGSLFPNWEGGVQERFFELTGNRLKLSTPPIQWGGGEIVAVLVWERIG
jgi:hypothetical protein